ncbi:hypothetical protein [Paenibacillus silvisoli]|uniref:hypothetical protein n=1 Tax=Paenibacillus silvisoli TaxID=3110539 RepID=UPI0028053EA3|nr:hypothetical protein [Paenibacillus silvisoli]
MTHIVQENEVGNEGQFADDMVDVPPFMHQSYFRMLRKLKGEVIEAAFQVTAIVASDQQ